MQTMIVSATNQTIEQEDRVGHRFHRGIPCGMDWDFPTGNPPSQESGTFLRLVLILALFAKEEKNWIRRRGLVHSYVSSYSSRYSQKKRNIGQDVGVWYIPTRHVKLEL